jgi:cell division protein FtsW
MARFKRSNKFNRKPVDKVTLVLILVILLFGLFMVYEASVVYADNIFGGKYHFLLQQLGWVTVGLIGMGIFSIINLDLIKKHSTALFILTLVVLLFILIPTIFSLEAYGARRWLILNPKPFPTIPIVDRLSIQPSELAKLTGIIFFSAYLSSNKLSKKFVTFKNELHYYGFYFLFLGLLLGSIYAEPNFTTATIVMVIMLSLLFFANSPLYLFFAVMPIAGLIGSLLVFTSDYRRQRLITLLSPDSVDKFGAGYHIRQIMIALGSGGFWGLGLGKSVQKHLYLPEVTADSIFAVVGEEFGFIGTLFLCTLFLALILRCFSISQNAEDKFPKLLSAGVATWLGIQTIINIGAMVRIMPITGVPLPLVSYGGSATVFLLWGLGLVLNASRNVKLNNDEKESK